jgi:3-oxoacyl-[acyl-carrier protein] reductase
MDFELQGKHVLVTGGTSGIGRAIVGRLVEQGARVTTCYRSEGEAVESLTAELAPLAGAARLVRADISDEGQVQRLVDEAQAGFGPFDGLVNNAGVISYQPLAQLATSEWNRIIDTNVNGVYYLVRAALSHFRNPASIVNISSKLASIGAPNAAHYVTSKAAILGLTRALCKELGPQGVRVNAIAAAFVDHTGHKHPRGEEGKTTFTAMSPLRRVAEPADLADVALFLLSDAARYVNGATIDVDSGI